MSHEYPDVKPYNKEQTILLTENRPISRATQDNLRKYNERQYLIKKNEMLKGRVSFLK